MITQTQILRMVESQAFARLVDRLITNGRCHSPVAIKMLQQPETAGPAALGLALQRLCEITYWPSPDGTALAHRLVRMQRRDGVFCGGASADSGARVAATAVALRGLIDWVTQHNDQRATGGNDDRLAIIRKAIARAWEALAREWRDARTRGKCDEAVWAIALWQLGDCDDARKHLPIDEIRRNVIASSAALLADDLTRLAITLDA